MRRISVLLALMSAVLLTLAACGSDGPQDLSFDLSVEHRELVPAGDIVVSQGDSVTMTVTVDEPGSVHLHGYDIEVEAAPGAPAVIAFTADATGRFGLMFHAMEEDEHTAEEHADGELDVVLAAVEVRP